MNLQKEIIIALTKICKVPMDEIDVDTRIYESKIISSLQILNLMSHLEEKFNIIILPEELILDNFMDVKSLVKYISMKISS